MGKSKLLEFQASISDVKQINPLFSTCKVRVLYTGKNRNMSIITKESVEKALPTLKNIPIVGEYSEENKDYKGHGGSIDLDSYKYVHTTKPYGVVPESATYEWEEVRGKEYLTINGCYLWTGRYEEAYSIVEQGKSQSMEIEVLDGQWVEEEESYRIDNFVFSALCILGDNVEPAFEDASITAYSLDKDSFKKEFTIMLNELKSTLSKEKEVDNMTLKELLEKYSLTVEDLTAKGIDLNEISEDELEEKIIEVFEIEANPQPEGQGDGEQAPEGDGESQNQEGNEDQEPQPKGGEEPKGDDGKEDGEGEPEGNKEPEQEPENPEGEGQVDAEDLQSLIQELESENHSLTDKVKTLEIEVEGLRQFKLDVEKADHEAKVATMFSNFQLSKEDVEGLDIHAFSLDEIEEKCYAILGKKLASKKNFSKSNENIKLPIVNNEEKDEQPKPYGGLFEKYNK